MGSLGLDVTLDQLSAVALAKIAPAIVGQAGWAVLTPKPATWATLKSMATARFGLTAEKLEDAFFNLKPTTDENTARFITRVEGVRALCGYPDRALLHSFDKHFSPKFATAVRHIKQTIAVTARRPLNWGDVVALAAEEKDTPPTTCVPATANKNDSSARAAPTATRPENNSGGPPRPNPPFRPRCSTCSRLGIGGDRHEDS